MAKNRGIVWRAGNEPLKGGSLGLKSRGFSGEWKRKPFRERLMIENRERIVAFVKNRGRKDVLGRNLVWLFNSNPDVRRGAAFRLGELNALQIRGRSRAVLRESLLLASRDPEESVRFNARASLERLKLIKE